jgi:hypothetical protein
MEEIHLQMPIKIATPASIIQNFQLGKLRLLRNDPDVVASQFGTEQESTKDYEGRVIFELFQNAVDRANQVVAVQLTPLTLTVSNDGQPFSIYDGNINGKKSDFHGICTIHNSSKKADESIGNKGVGFKSIWNISKEVCIESVTDEGKVWGFQLFNPVTFAHFEEFNDLFSALADQSSIPSFYFPKYKQPVEDVLKLELANGLEFSIVTRITVSLEEGIYPILLKQLEIFRAANLCFLPLLPSRKKRPLSVYTEHDGNVILNEEHENWQVFQLYEAPLITRYSREIQHLQTIREEYSKRYRNLPTQPNVAIAFPLNNKTLLKNAGSKVYTYLPTQVNLGFNILLHGDFALDNSRTSIPANIYNSCLFRIAVKMFTDLLAEQTFLHTLSHFHRFLISDSPALALDDKENFQDLVWQTFHRDHFLRNVLRKVYSTSRTWAEDAYKDLFEALEHLFKKKVFEHTSSYNSRVQEIEKAFCSDGIFIVPIKGADLTYLPRSNNSTSRSSLFFRGEAAFEKLPVQLLEKLPGLKISSFEPLNKSIFKDRKLVKEFSNINLLDVLLNIQNQNSDEETQERIFAFAYTLAIGKDRTELRHFFDTVSTSREERLLGEIKVPTTDGWQIATETYANTKFMAWIDPTYFQEVDIVRVSNILKRLGLEVSKVELSYLLQKMGVWYDLLPLKWIKTQTPYTFSLPWRDVPQDNTTELKRLINGSLLQFSSFPQWPTIQKLLKKSPWFYVNNLDAWQAPDQVFLFNEKDNRKLSCIAKENRKDEFLTLYNLLHIENFDRTESSKLIAQLTVMAETLNFTLESGHVDIYKALISALAKKSDLQQYDQVPILVRVVNEYKYRIDSTVFHASRDFKKHKRFFPDLHFACFDDEVSQEFCLHCQINLFQPKVEIAYMDAQKQADQSIKQFFETHYLAEMLTLAEERLGSKLNKDEVMDRWQRLIIYKGTRLSLRVSLPQGSETVFEDTSNNGNVFYIPLTAYDREKEKAIVGEIAHDLDEVAGSMQLSRFALFFADGLFRENRLHELLVGYLDRCYLVQTGKADPELKDNFLIEHGVSAQVIEDMKLYMNARLLSDAELNEFVHMLSNFALRPVGIDNWSQIFNYQGRGLSFKELKAMLMPFPKFANLGEQLNPIHCHRMDLHKQQSTIQALYYLTHQQVLSEEVFRSILYSSHTDCDFFDFDLSNFYAAFDIRHFSADEINTAIIDLKYGLFDIQPSMEPIQLTGAKNDTQPKANPHVQVVNPSAEEHKRQQQHKRGIGLEVKLIHQAVQAIDPSNYPAILHLVADLIQAEQKSMPIGAINKYLAKIEELKKRPITPDDFKQILHVSKTIGDGLGYDILIPKIQPDLQILKVEVKSAVGRNQRIYLSENERLRILTLKDDPQWRFWLNGECDITLTQQIGKYVTEHNQQLEDLIQKQKLFLSAVDWFIDFQTA